MTTAVDDTWVLTGGCLCGAVRWRAEGRPRLSLLCHCRHGRVAAGAPAVAWVIFPAEGFAFTTGQARRYRTDTQAERTFCGTCGSPLTYRADARSHEVDVTAGSTDDPERFPPTGDAHAQERLSWTHTVEPLRVPDRAPGPDEEPGPDEDPDPQEP